MWSSNKNMQRFVKLLPSIFTCRSTSGLQYVRRFYSTCNTFFTCSSPFFVLIPPLRHTEFSPVNKLAPYDSFLQQLRGRLPSLASSFSEFSSRHPSAWSEHQARPSRATGNMAASGVPDNNVSRSYLSETLSAYSPWGSTRTSTPKPPDGHGDDGPIAAPSPTPPAQRGGDHSVRMRRKIKREDYPRDCPRLAVQWYHAVDVRHTLVVSVQADGDCIRSFPWQHD